VSGLCCPRESTGLHCQAIYSVGALKGIRKETPKLQGLRVGKRQLLLLESDLGRLVLGKNLYKKRPTPGGNGNRGGGKRVGSGERKRRNEELRL